MHIAGIAQWTLHSLDDGKTSVHIRNTVHKACVRYLLLAKEV
jgi:hypothetical protein